MIDREQVLHVARLARLQLTDEEVERMAGELSKILGHIDTINELDLEGVPPTSHVVEVANAVRPDVPRRILSIVSKLMAKNPDERFQTPDELMDALAPHAAPGTMDWPIAPPVLAAEASKATPGKPLTPEQMVERHFVKTAKVHMNQGASYGLGGANHMRMNIATSRKTLDAALTGMARALDSLGRSSAAL